MSQRHVLPPETEKEQIFIGLTMPQLMWAATGIAVGFGVTILFASITDSLLTGLIIGIPLGATVLPFMFYRPMHKSMTLSEYLRYKWAIKRRNNELPNKGSAYVRKQDFESTILSTEGKESKHLSSIDIQLGREK